MTEFDKAVRHIRTCLFWDFADGQWLDTLYTPLDRDYFNRLMQGVLEAHEAENAKLRELVADMFALLDGADCARFPAGDVVITQAQVGNFYDRMRELGIEVDE